MSSTGVVLSTTQTFSGALRSWTIPSCVLEHEDLPQLFSMLNRLALEAADLQVGGMTQQAGQTAEQFESLKDLARSLMRMNVQVFGRDGRWTGGQNRTVLDEEELPDRVQRIVFDSALLYRAQLNNQNPSNYFVLTLDFSQTGILDFSSPPSQSTSRLDIGGQVTWASAVQKLVSEFFEKRRSPRAWLHHPHTYDFLVALLGFPLSFYFIFTSQKLISRVGQWLPLATALSVYLIFLSLWFFRIGFNYLRWVFPKCELAMPRQKVARIHKAIVSFLALGVLGALRSLFVRILGF